MNASALYMILSSFLFAWMGVCVRLASPALPVSEVIFFRGLIGLILILPILFIQKTSIWGTHRWKLMARGFFGFMALSLYFWSISRIPLATAVMLNYTSPLFVACLAPLLLKEKFRWKIFIWILLGFIGVILIVNPQPDTNHWGQIIGLISGIFASLAYLSIGALKELESSLTIVFYFFIVATVGILPIAILEFKMPTPQEMIYLSGVGVSSTVAQILMTKAYRMGTTATTSAYSSSIVLFSFILGIIFWNEWPPFSSFIGGIFIVLSVIWIAKLEKSSHEM